MQHRAIIALFLIVSLMGCAGTPAQTGDTPVTTPTDIVSQSPTTASGGTYSSTDHMGCQPGAIEKDGACHVVANGSNADIFQVKDLQSIETHNTTLNGTPGYLARPSAEGEYPSVIMIHEWWGLNRNIRQMADILAGHGYVVFAVDLYDGEVATNSSEAGALAGSVRENPEVAMQKMTAAVKELRARDDTTDRVASLGWCFGGGQSLSLSLSDAALNATVMYYPSGLGAVANDTTAVGRIDGPVLGIFGADDPVVSAAAARGLDRSLDETGIEHDIYIYENASHAFANPSGEQFRPDATRDAWEKTLRFLDQNLRSSNRTD